MRFQIGDPAYRTLLSWISAGCPDPKNQRSLVNLEVFPSACILRRESPHKPFSAVVHFSDGTSADVTDHAVFMTRQDDDYPAGMRAVGLAEGAVENHFLMAFSRPIRDTACDCARETEPNLGESLHLLNNPDIIRRIAAPEGRLGKLLAQDTPDERVIETLYLASLSRRPTPAETRLVNEHIELLGDRRAALQDLQHALLNCNEFLLRH